MFEGREGELLASATPVNKATAEKKLYFTPLFNNAHYDAIPHRIDSPVPRTAIASGGADDKAVRSPVSSPETAFVSIVDFFVVGRTATLRSSLLLCGRAAAAAEPETAMRAAEAGAGADEALQTPGAPRRDERALDERMVWWRRWKQRKNKREVSSLVHYRPRPCSCFGAASPSFIRLRFVFFSLSLSPLPLMMAPGNDEVRQSVCRYL